MSLPNFLIDILIIIKTGVLTRITENLTDSVLFQPNIVTPSDEKGYDCEYCGTFVPLGRRICRGCGAKVVYRGIPSELKNAAQFGSLFVGGMFCLLLFIELPKWLNSIFLWNLSPGFGLGIYAFLISFFIM